MFLKLIGKGELDAYYRGYYRKVKKALEEWHESGKDILLSRQHGCHLCRIEAGSKLSG